jgi:hypothetical protein
MDAVAGCRWRDALDGRLVDGIDPQIDNDRAAPLPDPCAHTNG